VLPDGVPVAVRQRSRKQNNKDKKQNREVMKSTIIIDRKFSALKSILTVAALALFLAGNVAMAARDPNNGLIANVNGSYHSQSYEEWAVEWWQTMYSIPVVNGLHPLLSGGAVISNNTVFLAATVGTPTTIEVTIPSGTSIFMPIVNAECSTIEPEPFHGDTEPELRACANGHIDNTSGLSATIDAAPVSNLLTYRTQSPLFEFTLPENNVLEFQGIEAPAGTTAQAVDAGVYLLLKPLSKGTTHTLRVQGTFEEFGLAIDTTFRITVQ
jgi:hypothetical protein